MPKVPINIIKEWFRNTMKPPEAQFWAWLDSFWHKDEPIPISAVENLTTVLQNKADLVDGVVPEEQLPFSVVTSEIITLGASSITDNTVNLAVHSSGENKVRVKGKLITRTFPNSWTFTELVGTGYKVLRGYAVKWEDDFFLAEGEELPNITDPEIPENALQLFKFTISASGVVLEENEEPGFKLQAEDNFKNVVIPSSTPVSILIAESPSSSFNILPNVFDPKISGIRTKSGKNSRDGHEITLYNDSDIPVTILAGAYSESSVVTTYGFAEEFIIKPHTYQKFKRRNNLYEVLGGGGGGGASFPELGNNGDVLVKDSASADGAVWSNRLTNVETIKLDKPLTPNNVATKIILGDGSTKNISDFSQVEQVEVGSSGNAQEAWKGKLVLITASCTITIPTGLSNNWSCEIATMAGVTLTWAITSPKTWLFGTPPTFPEKSMCTISQRGTTNHIMLFGGYGL